MLENSSKTYLFIDESGDHGLTKVDSDFPVFILSGILMNENSCQKITRSLDELKKSIWTNNEIILHSRDIRKCEKEFKLLFDPTVKGRFYELLNDIIKKASFTIFASGIKKKHFY
jgi:hypothetical protein